MGRSNPKLWDIQASVSKPTSAPGHSPVSDQISWLHAFLQGDISVRGTGHSPVGKTDPTFVFFKEAVFSAAPMLSADFLNFSFGY